MYPSKENTFHKEIRDKGSIIQEAIPMMIFPIAEQLVLVDCVFRMG